jgi:hypothetical protein
MTKQIKIGGYSDDVVTFDTDSGYDETYMAGDESIIMFDNGVEIDVSFDGSWNFDVVDRGPCDITIGSMRTDEEVHLVCEEQPRRAVVGRPVELG